MPGSAKPLALMLISPDSGAPAALESQCELVAWREIADRDAFLTERGGDVRIIVTAGGVPIKSTLTDRLPNLGLVAYYGAGYGGIDVLAMRARGVQLSNCPATNNEDVADVAVGLTIAAVRRLPECDMLVRSGDWKGAVPIRLTPSLRELRYGILGLGAIGAAIAERLEPFGGRIAWWGPRPKPHIRWPRAESMMALARDSDVLILALKADASTANIVDADVLKALGPDGYLINVSRGIAVDEEALILALKNDGIAGAGLDVFAKEPSDPAQWRDLINVALAPHIGGWAHSSIQAAQRGIAENVRRFLAGEDLLTPIPA